MPAISAKVLVLASVVLSVAFLQLKKSKTSAILVASDILKLGCWLLHVAVKRTKRREYACSLSRKLSLIAHHQIGIRIELRSLSREDNEQETLLFEPLFRLPFNFACFAQKTVS